MSSTKQPDTLYETRGAAKARQRVDTACVRALLSGL